MKDILALSLTIALLEDKSPMVISWISILCHYLNVCVISQSQGCEIGVCGEGVLSGEVSKSSRNNLVLQNVCNYQELR